jgi:hypothetical protein
MGSAYRIGHALRNDPMADHDPKAPVYGNL